MQSIYHRLSNEFSDLDLSYLEMFMGMVETISSSPMYGFKYSSLQLEYHQVKSKTSTSVQIRCVNCKMATEPFYFILSLIHI